MKTKDTLILSLLMLLIGLGVWTKFSIPKIAYVKSAALIDGFTGMKEASIEYQKKTTEWQSNIDSLRSMYEREVALFKKDSLTYSLLEKQKKIEALSRKKGELLQYVTAIKEKSGKEDELMTQQVMNQINSFVEKYGKERGYTVIMGTTSSGNLLYASQAVDVTDDVLKEINNSYSK